MTPSSLPPAWPSNDPSSCHPRSLSCAQPFSPASLCRVAAQRKREERKRRRAADEAKQAAEDAAKAAKDAAEAKAAASKRAKKAPAESSAVKEVGTAECVVTCTSSLTRQASCRLRQTTRVYVYVARDALCRDLATVDLVAVAAGF